MPAKKARCHEACAAEARHAVDIQYLALAHAAGEIDYQPVECFERAGDAVVHHGEVDELRWASSIKSTGVRNVRPEFACDGSGKLHWWTGPEVLCWHLRLQTDERVDRCLQPQRAHQCELVHRRWASGVAAEEHTAWDQPVRILREEERGSQLLGVLQVGQARQHRLGGRRHGFACSKER